MKLLSVLPNLRRDHITDHFVVVEDCHSLIPRGTHNCRRIALEVAHADRKLRFHALKDLVHSRLLNSVPNIAPNSARSIVPALAGRIDLRAAVEEMDDGILRGKPVHRALVREAFDQVAEDAQDAAV